MKEISLYHKTRRSAFLEWIKEFAILKAEPKTKKFSLRAGYEFKMVDANPETRFLESFSSDFFLEALKESEYDEDYAIKVEDGAIRFVFKRSLPFVRALEKATE
jgi:hypothetical protein